MSTVEKLQSIGEKYAIKLPALMLIDLLDVVFDARLEVINDIYGRTHEGGEHE